MGDGVRLRVATAADIPFLSNLASDPLVEPYLAPGAGAPERLDAVATSAEADGHPGGLFLIESDAGEAVGGLALIVFSRHSRLCDPRLLMVSPHTRGAGVGTEAIRVACRYALVEHGFHRLQAETYGDNVAGQRAFGRAGFVREGVRRRAYRRRDQWLDGVLFGILVDELRG